MKPTQRGCGPGAPLLAPDPQHLLRLDREFRTGTTTAWCEIAAAVFPWLVRRLAGRFGWLGDETRWCDAVTLALEQYRLRPDRFQPERGWTLPAFLLNTAAANLRHALRPRCAHVQFLAPAKLKNLDKISRLCDWPGYLVIGDDYARRLLRIAVAFPEPEQSGLLSLGAAPDEGFADWHGLGHLPPYRRALAVKRLRERLRNKVRAMAAKRVEFCLTESSPVLLRAPRSCWANTDSRRQRCASPHWRDIGDPASGLFLRAGHDALKELGTETVFDIALDVDRRCREVPEMFDPVAVYRYSAGGHTVMGTAPVVFDDEDTARCGYPSRHGLVLVCTWKEWHRQLMADGNEDARKRRERGEKKLQSDN